MMASFSVTGLVSSLRFMLSPASSTGSRFLCPRISHSSDTLSFTSGLVKNGVLLAACVSSRGLHTTALSLRPSKSSMKSPGEAMDQPQRWNAYNKVLLPPQQLVEARRPAQVFHQRTQIRGSNLRMWYAACAVRGMSIDDALDYCTFNTKKGPKIIKEVLLEAQEIALRDHNFEFKSKMWVAESFSGRGTIVKGVRRHARRRFGEVRYGFCHYFVKLEEGDPPATYYRPTYVDDLDSLTVEQINQLRRRRVGWTL